MKLLLTFTALLLAASLWAAPPYERNQFSTNTPAVSPLAVYYMGQVYVRTNVTATNGFSSDGVNFTLMPSNAPVSGYFIVYTGTGGATANTNRIPLLSVDTINLVGASNAIVAVNASGNLVPTNTVHATNFVAGTNTIVGPTNTPSIGRTYAVIDGGAIGTTGLPFEYKTNTVSKFSVDTAGAIVNAGGITAGGTIQSLNGNVNIPNAFAYFWGSFSRITSPQNAVIALAGTSGIDFNMLLFGGGNTALTQFQSTNWPAIRVTGTNASWLGNPLMTVQGGTNNNKVADFAVNGAGAFTNGVASLATNTTMTVSSTGCTNMTGVNQKVYLTAGTGVQMFDNRTNAVWSGTQTFTTLVELNLQARGSITGTAITSIGTHAW